MDKLPSRHAISEVMTWISLMENVIQKDEENIKNSIGYKAIHEYLQKYKVIKHFVCLFLTFHILGQFYLKELKNSNHGNQVLECMFQA